MRNQIAKQLLFVLLVSTVVAQSCASPAAPATPGDLANPATPTEISIETLPPPLAKVEFPEDTKPYPPDWPSDLHLSEVFRPVDFNQGTLPGGDKPAWSLKARFEGTIQDAANALQNVLAEQNWQIADETELDTGGKLWIIQKESSSGIVILDVQEASRVVIIATFYL